MLLSIVESILPGARNLRPPLIAGLLWSILLWIVFAPRVPDQGGAEGWFAQAYALFSALGTSAAIVIAIILIFSLGTAFVNVTDYVAAAIARVSVPVRARLDWRRHSRRGVRALRRRRETLDEQVAALSNRLASGPSTPDEQRELNQRVALERDLKEATDRLSSLERLRAQSRWSILGLADTPDARRLLGQPPSKAEEGLEYDLVEQRQWAGRVAAIEAGNHDFGASEIRRYAPSGRGFENQLLSELQADPLDLLRALDEALYLQLDRERAEREVRIAAALPLTALSLLGGFRLVWWVGLGAALGAALLVRYALAQLDERTRVLNFIRLKGLETPALRAAYAQGREDVRAFEARRRQEQSALPSSQAP